MEDADIELVVPPDSYFPEGSKKPKPRSPRKTLGMEKWVKTHKALAIMAPIAGGIAVLIITFAITGQQVSLFGFQLNPLYNSAALCSIKDCTEELVLIEQPTQPVTQKPQEIVATGPVCADPEAIKKLAPVYRYWNSATMDHVFTTDQSEGLFGYKYEGIIGYVFKEQIAGSTPIYRSSNSAIGSHYYTVKQEDPTQYGYKSEGVLGYAFSNPEESTFAWYRLHKGGAVSDLINTTDINEKNELMNIGYKDDGIAAYICTGVEAGLPLE